ncbi:DUF3168 domain-containing protein [Novosphingobium sp. FSY-8]|uniref:DUF3168 domain-containing protein n=1 Tax=Novosphingobium ovatum TaxID=1908523 RepID=A0ABW9XFP0_9SPHN|nr:DUF3168 domain-containing protein [Novosphingobium ovatum]NBC37362.1 DUF3168 domain-containing protein [Novosphingobium ovatum]
MATTLQRLVRRALLAHLKADTGLTDLVPAGSINPAGVPTWPHILLRAPLTRPFYAAAVEGAEVSWDVHAFAGPRESAGAVAETAEDHAGSIGGAIETALSPRWIDLEDGGRVRVRLSDIRLLEDGDRDHYHWFAQINCRVLAA